MALWEKVYRGLKLGVFIGAGTAVALVAACSSAAKRLDTGVKPADAAVDSKPKSDGAADAGVGDGRVDGARDGAVVDATPRDATRDKRRWDIPLE